MHLLATTPAPKIEDDCYDWWARHAAVLAAKDAIDPEIVLVGDSITHFWGGDPVSPGSPRNGVDSFAETFAGMRVLNLGFGYDRTQNVLWRFAHGELDGLHPRVAVVNIGTNNLGRSERFEGNTPRETARGVEAVCEDLERRCPGVRIVLTAIFPKGRTPDFWERPLVAELNRLLVDIAARHAWRRIDINAQLLDADGVFPEPLSVDGIHPTLAGYRLWGAALRPVLLEFLAMPPLLRTEARNPATAHLDRATTPDMLRLIQEANRRSVEAVQEALPQIARVVDAAATAVAGGGRIIYVGAGTSGRLAVQDAAECPPTYGVDPGIVVALMAGGREAVFRAAEGGEDNADAGRRDMLALDPGPRDLVIGVSAAGGAAFVVAAMEAARERGATTASLSSNSGTAIERAADLPIFVDTGAEVVTGSTRMKAGNAQKMVLNMVSTCAMVKTGKVIGNLMVNLRPTNRKLRARMIGIVEELAGVAPDRAEALLEASGWSIPAALARGVAHAEGEPHAEFAQTKPHAESSEFAETKPHAEFAEFPEMKPHAESAETVSSPPSERNGAQSAPLDPPPSERGVARSAGGSTSRRAAIVLPDAPTPVERTAAAELADGLLRISGESVPIVSESSAPSDSFRFLIGNTWEARAAASVGNPWNHPCHPCEPIAPKASERHPWAEDEILVLPIRGGIVLTGHPARGPIYAVDTLLEEGYGVRWWTSREADWPSRPVLPCPSLTRRHAPPFRFREASFLDAYDPDFRVRLKGNFVSRIRWATEPVRFVPPEKGGCHRLHFFEGRRSAYHSFFEILPPDRHFAAHPEWYSLVDGERRAKQLCLTNPEMEAAFIEETLRLLRADPDADFLSVSQNDWQGACECAECRAVEAATGGVPAGPLLAFVNRVAEAVEREFPRVTVETFAYQYTRHAPANIRPRRNVLVRLCDIECPFSMPLATADHPASADFRRNLADWTSLAPGQVFIWDYVADFHNYLLPHPNLLALGPNIRLFAESGAVGVFEQGDTCSGAGEFAPLRLWLLSHLLWNPAADDRALIDEFVRGYWGEGAAPHILRAIALVNEPPAAGGVPVRCYHADCSGWMGPATIVAAARAMDIAAAAAAAQGEPYATRVRRETLSMRHALLLHWDACRAFCEAQHLAWPWGAKRADAAHRWIDDVRAFGVRTVRETTAEDAAALFDKHCAELLGGEPGTHGLDRAGVSVFSANSA